MNAFKPKFTVSSPGVKSEIDISIALEAARRRIKELEDEVDLAAAGTFPSEMSALVTSLQNKNESLTARKNVLKAKISRLREKNQDLKATDAELRRDYEALQKAREHDNQKLKKRATKIHEQLERMSRNAYRALEAKGIKGKAASDLLNSTHTTSGERSQKRWRSRKPWAKKGRKS
ncbi:hypothetical protein DFH06DRAFT_1166682 [Mycena polygramma]|nr:hypothetical protein DFH06DRAFT_1166682 [Mycena polygramma]